MPYYADHLYLVWGFHGILLIDAASHTEAQGVYCQHFDCHVTMVELCMRAPTPSLWAEPWDPEEPEHDCGYDDEDGDGTCAVCASFSHVMESIEVDPGDPRLREIDVEGEKTALAAAFDQMNAYMRDKHGAQDPATQTLTPPD